MKVVAYHRTGGPAPNSEAIDAAKSALTDYLKRRPTAKVVAEYFESQGTDRLEKAIKAAKKVNAVLVISKSVHIKRNSNFLRCLAESGVEFYVCDNIGLTRKTIQSWLDAAEKRRSRLSQRLKDVLAEKREEGVLLGAARPGHCKGKKNWHGWREAAKVSGENRTQRAREAYRILEPQIFAMLDKGHSLPEVAARLNDEGYTTTAGKPFTPTAVWRIVDRAKRVAVA